MIELTDVSDMSSDVLGYRFDPVRIDKRKRVRLGTLYVRYSTYALFAYARVPEPIFQRIVRSKSIGAAIHQFVKNAGYSFQRLA